MEYLYATIGELCSASFLLVTLLVFLLERLLPIERNQKIFTKNVYLDFFYILFGPPIMLLLDVFYISSLASFLKGHMPSFNLGIFEGLHPTIRIIMAFFFIDFLMWSNHLIRHKVPLLWRFHKVHHSQTDMNQFTDQRGHILELFIIKTYMAFFLLAFNVNFPSIVLLSTINTFITRMSHSRVRTNWGLFKYLFVTPQSHRIHHSNLPPHQDKNYGYIFSIWDRLFKTSYHRYDEYPQTGIADVDFPISHPGKLSFFLTPIMHFTYPFKEMFGEMTTSRSYLIDRTRKIPD